MRRFGGAQVSRILQSFIIVAATSLVSEAGSAAVFSVNDRAAFEAALAGEVTIDFEGIAPDGGSVSFMFPGYNNNGVVFYGQGSAPQNTVIADQNAGFTSGPYNSDILFIANKFLPLRIEFAASVSGVGGFFGGLSGLTPAVLDVFGETDTVTPMATFNFTAGDIALTETFFGVISTGEAIGKVLFTPGTDWSAVDNLTYSTDPTSAVSTEAKIQLIEARRQAVSEAKVAYLQGQNALAGSTTVSAVPLPGSLWLLGSGLMGISLAARKNRSGNSAA